ncbi:WD40-repeat-containing domain protein, partial [Parasitella parasitica]
MFITQRDASEKKPGPNQVAQTGYTIQNDGFFVSVKNVHKVATFIQHWQLRNLIVSPGNNTIIRTRRNALYKYDAKSGIDTCLQDNLPFTPTSIHTKCGFLALGGQTGTLMIKDLSTGCFEIKTAGRGMNNSICLYQHQNDIRMAVCNKDQTVSVFTIPDMEKMQTLKMPSAINYSSVSPDGKKVLLTSDQGFAFLYRINEDGFYTDKCEYRVSEAPTLSCAWNQSSDVFAITSQDGFVSIYNIYSATRLCRLGSSETRKTKKAPRSVQFSTGPLDLLAYAEHVNNLYIVDTRTFETRQIVRLSPENEDRSITGLTFSPDSKLLYVGMEDRLVELQVDVPARRQFGSGRL